MIVSPTDHKPEWEAQSACGIVAVGDGRQGAGHKEFVIYTKK